jgi:hypothetical protein
MEEGDNNDNDDDDEEDDDRMWCRRERDENCVYCEFLSLE